MAEGIHASTPGNAPGYPELQAQVDRWLEFMHLNKGRSARTVEVYRLALGRLAVWLLKIGRPWNAITGDELLIFTGKWLHEQGLRDPLSRRTHVAAVRGFYAWARDRGLVLSDPAVRVPYPAAGRRLPKVLTLGNAERLMWAPDFATFDGLRDATMISLLIGCGLRVAGLVRLNESHIVHDVIDGQPRILLKVTEKGNKDRRLPVPEQADLLLRLYLEHPYLEEIDRTLPDGDKVLFITTRNRRVAEHEYIGAARRMTTRAVQAMVRKYGEQQGLPANQLNPHAMRHLFGTELAEDDVAPELRKELMGHADIKSTEIYTHLAIRHATRASDKANPLAKMRTPASDLINQLKGKKT